MAKLSRLKNGHWAIDTESTIPQINALQIFYRSGDTGFLLKQQSIIGSRIIYADDTGASHIVPSATNNEPLTLVILDSSNNLILEEIIYFSSNIFKEYLDLAGANFNPTWKRLNYNKSTLHNVCRWLDFLCRVLRAPMRELRRRCMACSIRALLRSPRCRLNQRLHHTYGGFRQGGSILVSC